MTSPGNTPYRNSRKRNDNPTVQSAQRMHGYVDQSKAAKELNKFITSDVIWERKVIYTETIFKG